MKHFKTEIKWAVIFTLVALLWMFMEKTLGWHDELISKHQYYTNFFFPIPIAIYVLALLDKRKNYFNNKMSFVNGMMSGGILSVLIALLTPLAQWITHNLISTEYFNNAINYAVSNDKMSQLDAETFFNFANYVKIASFSALTMGIITAAMVAGVLALLDREK